MESFIFLEMLRFGTTAESCAATDAGIMRDADARNDN